MASTFERVKRVIVGLHHNAALVTEAAALADDLGLDSLDRLELAMKIEEEFGIHVRDEDLEDAITVGDLVKLADRLRASEPPTPAGANPG